MSDANDITVERRRRIVWALLGVALAATLAVSAPAWAQSAEDLNLAELNRIATVPVQSAMPSYPTQGYVYPADIDCNDAYYASYCLMYAMWLNQYYAAYGYPYDYPYDYWSYGYGYDVAVGIGFFGGHRFHNFHHFVSAHGIGFHGGFHAGGFHGGGFHGGGAGRR